MWAIIVVTSLALRRLACGFIRARKSIMHEVRQTMQWMRNVVRNASMYVVLRGFCGSSQPPAAHGNVNADVLRIVFVIVVADRFIRCT